LSCRQERRRRLRRSDRFGNWAAKVSSLFRFLPDKLGAFALLATAVGAAPAHAMATTYNPKIQLVGGGDLPYTPVGKDVVA
jgi:hypothetical protein